MDSSIDNAPSGPTEPEEGWPAEVTERFDVERELGRGGQGIAYLAEDGQTGDRVVLKWLALPFAEDWKAMELFEREAELLEQIDHPRIPEYVDDIAVEDGFFLVQSYAPGRPLEELTDEEWTESEIEAFLADMLDLLVHLQQMSPPVVHRDIKPSNIIQSSEGTYYLVDFGSVQATMAGPEGGSTFAGTSGFIPPEQLRGQAVPASDLYGLAATAIHLGSGMHPSEIPVRKMRPDFRQVWQPSVGLAGWLDQMLAPGLDERFDDARQARQALDDCNLAARRATLGSIRGDVVATREGSSDHSDQKVAFLRTVLVMGGIGGIALVALCLLVLGMAATTQSGVADQTPINIVIIAGIGVVLVSAILVLLGEKTELRVTEEGLEPLHTHYGFYKREGDPVRWRDLERISSADGAHRVRLSDGEWQEWTFRDEETAEKVRTVIGDASA